MKSHSPVSSGWTRRDLLKTGVAWTAGVAAMKFFAPSAFAAPPASAWNPLAIPDAAPPDLPMLITAQTMVNLGDGVPRAALTYNGQLPGPTWVARTGDVVTTTLANGLVNDPTITHWHGLIVDFPNDGGPLLEIGPDETYDYAFPIIQRAGLSFYHPHPHMLTGEQVCLGLAGAFIIRDDEEDELKLPRGPYEVPLVIRDVTFDGAGNLQYNPTSSGFRGKFPLVNGTLNPRLDVDRGVYRFRVLNGANARTFRLAMSNNAPFTIIGNDGGLIPAPAMVTEILLGMGERLDLLVDFSYLSAGDAVTLRCLDARWDLVRFVGTGRAGLSYVPPAVLCTIPRPLGPRVPTRTFSFDGMSRINGLEYDMDRVDFAVPLGNVERWRFITGGNAPHPVHVHGAHFHVMSRTGGRGQLYPWEAGWKDTVLLSDHETVDVLIRFTGYRGAYVMHCHQLEHESMGMMQNFNVE